MLSYIYESIEMKNDYTVKCFLAAIDKSDFHWHYEYELIVVLKGSICIGARPEPAVLEAGDIILINTQEVHELRKTAEENLCLFVQFRESMVEDFREGGRTYRFYLNSKGKECRLAGEVYERFRTLTAKIGECYLMASLPNHYRTKGYLNLLIADLFALTGYDVVQNIAARDMKEETDILYQIVSYVQEHFREEDIREKLCREIGKSEKTLYRFLKGTVGMSLKEMVLNCKIELAMRLLKTTEKPVSAIADICGFSSENSFFRIFKQMTGTTPAEYRRDGRKECSDGRIQGYMNYNSREASSLLLDYAKGGCRI